MNLFLFLDNIIQTIAALPTYGKIILAGLAFFIVFSIIKRFLKLAIMLAIFVLLVLFILRILLHF